MIKIIQININHCEVAHDMLEQMARTEKADILLISDPYKTTKNNKCIHDKGNMTSIWICGQYPFQSTYDNDEGFVRAKINGINFYSCYAPPRLTTNEYQALLDNIVADARNSSPVVIGGDFNAWATEWGSRTTNSRGELLLQSFAALDLVLANNGDAPTFRRTGRSSIIDLTFVSTSLHRRTKWYVSEQYTHSDHQAVMTVIASRKPTCLPLLTGPKWKDSNIDTEALLEVLKYEKMNAGSAIDLSNQLIGALTNACDVSMPRRSYNKRGTPCYWWNDEIKNLRKLCLQHRRRVQRSRNRTNFDECLLAFKLARHELKKAVKKSKRECFKKLCDEANVDIWGTAYKVVMAKLKGGRTPQLMCPDMLKSIVSTLFPHRNPTSFNISRESDENDIPRVTTEEVLQACKKMQIKKAPGPDGIPNKAFKLAVQERPDLFVETMEKCFQEGVFPEKWKLQHLVLLPKGKGSYEEPSAYRPICLLDPAGKLFERVIYNRLLSHAESKGALSNTQFGFRKNRSTVDAVKTVVDIATTAIEGDRWLGGSKEYCAIVTLDVKNAFNSASWQSIRRALNQMETPQYLMKIIESYFTDRKLRYNTDEGLKFYSVSAGVPQGSVLGPLLWNIMYDGVLRLPMPSRTKVIGFADDIASVTVAKTIEEVETAANESIRQIRQWLQDACLELADHKTEAVLITSRKKVEFIEISVGRETIRSKESLKYLGVIIDNRLNFKCHVQYAADKASKLQSALARMLPNVGGPKPQKRLLLAKVVSSALLYAAPIFEKALTRKETKKKLTSVYRLSALRVISGYRTISDEAAFVIAGMIPIDILANEATRIYKKRKQLDVETQGRSLKQIREEERRTSMETWQSRWSNSTKGRWTYKLIPNLNVWTSRKSGVCCYQLTQFLSGHGGYRKYLFKFGHDDSPLCPTCNEEEDTDHAIFRCPRFDDVRNDNMTTETMVLYMLENDNNWDECVQWITTIQLHLREYEKRRINENRSIAQI